jgi:hypothetical protein
MEFHNRPILPQSKCVVFAETNQAGAQQVGDTKAVKKTQIHQKKRLKNLIFLALFN